MISSFPLFLVVTLSLLNVSLSSSINNEVYLQREQWIKAGQCILDCPNIEETNCLSECVRAADDGKLKKYEGTTAEEHCYFPARVSIEPAGNTTTDTRIAFLPVVTNQGKPLQYRNILYMLLKNGQEQEQYSFLAADKKTEFIIEMEIMNSTIMAIGNEGLMCELRMDYKEDEILVNYVDQFLNASLYQIFDIINLNMITEFLGSSVYQIFDIFNAKTIYEFFMGSVYKIFYIINLKTIKDPAVVTLIHRGVATSNILYDQLLNQHETQNVKRIKMAVCVMCLAIQESTGSSMMFLLIFPNVLGVINSCLILFAIVLYHLYYLYQ